MRPIETDRRRLVLGYLAALGSAFSYALGTVVGRKIVTEYAPPMVGVAFAMMFGTAVMAVLFHRHALRDLAVAPKRAWIHLMLAGLSSAWGGSFLFLALGEAPVVLVAPLAGTFPLVAVLLTHVFLQRLETVTRGTVAGALLVVAGVALIAVGRG
jgi:uncharacterized membrane protein